ncbi:GntR family transcriptional regulator [Roseateles sp. DAIF2]|uniref:GntR family transcriptional regulator n=1 Tax=Roseateles sp. DAIF2 TaxID=2714952 RepID=UPI0018A2E097|nr:GntR family transcriptional regulator [Roseateles sp. DAIF2]QPF75751.1 GntR family transcriptional regulator [Roseateles sp. DAIF2]
MSSQPLLEIDSSAGQPLYLRLMQQLLDEVRQGRWQTGLPSERKLSHRLSVSRHTARRALDLLCQRGMLERRRGSGTYLARPLVEAAAEAKRAAAPAAARVTSQAPASPAARQWLARQADVATPEELFALGLSPRTQVARLQWREAATPGAPGPWAALETRCLALQLLPRPQQFEQPFEDWLAEQDLTPVRELQRLRACNATPELAQLLGQPPGVALLHVTRQSYGRQGQALVLSQSYRLASQAGLVLELC